MKPIDINRAVKSKQVVAHTRKPVTKGQADPEKFDRARKALYEYWKLT
jgi:hypothetical protein